MKAIERILVVTDPTLAPDVHAQHAVERGLRLARELGAQLQLFVMCDYNEYLADAAYLDHASVQRERERLMAQRRAWLDDLALSLDTQAVRVSVDMAWDRPLHEGITRKVLRYKPDLVLKDTHHHSALRRTLLTNTDWHLIRECPAPLLLVRDTHWSAPPRVLAAIDPLHERDKPAALDGKILDTADYYAHRLGGELHVVHAYELLGSAGVVDGGYVALPLPARELNAKIESEHRAALAALLAPRNLPESRTHLLEGGTRKVVPAVAGELGASLVVMGAVARSAVGRVFIGSTAEKVLEFLPCDVLVVKPDGFCSPIELFEQDALFPRALECAS